MKGLRAFEVFVTVLVLGVVICFCIQLSLIKNASIGKVFRGYLPSGAITESNGYLISFNIKLYVILTSSLGSIKLAVS
jgi:metal iron transporter